MSEFGFVTPEMAQKALSIIETGSTALVNEAGTFLAEVINYLIFAEAMELVKTLFIPLVVASIIYRILSAAVRVYQSAEKDAKDELQEALNAPAEYHGKNSDIRHAKHRLDAAESNVVTWKGIRTLAVLVACGWSLYAAVNSAQSLGKIVFAPRLYLLEMVTKALKSTTAEPSKVQEVAK
jgi:hypothetical protein